MSVISRQKKRNRFTIRLDHYSRLHRLRDLQAVSPPQTTIQIMSVSEENDINGIVEGPFSKYCDDVGYFTYYDSFNDRNIVICHRNLGVSSAFRREHGITHCIDLKRTRDDSYIMLTAGDRKKIYAIMKSVVIQIADTPGNLCMYCIMGRSRSPAFLAAYMVVIGCYSTAEAYSILSPIFIRSRKDIRGIDRDQRFSPFVERLEMEVSGQCWNEKVVG